MKIKTKSYCGRCHPYPDVMLWLLMRTDFWIFPNVKCGADKLIFKKTLGYSEKYIYNAKAECIID